jgi:choline dehydrogenase-like flavoprotein
LTIVQHALTEKVVVEDGKAVGVKYQITKGRKETVNAHCAREVIVCGGAFGSPHLLLLSGIGAADKLTPHGIDQVANVPAVGENLHDHIDITLCYKAKMKDLFGVSLMGSVRMLGEMWKYRTKRQGLFTTNFAESGGFLYTDRAEPAPDVQLHMVRAIVDDHGRKLHMGHGYSCHVCVLRPKSRGTVELASADPTDHPLIDPAFLKDERDVDTLLRGAKLLQRILRAPAFERANAKALYAAESDDDAEILADIRARADTVYHPVGTCKMGAADDETAVVDPRLRVRGVAGLRVADASVIPQIVSGNTNAPAIMIGEKAADMIKKDWAA